MLTLRCSAYDASLVENWKGKADPRSAKSMEQTHSLRRFCDQREDDKIWFSLAGLHSSFRPPDYDFFGVRADILSRRLQGSRVNRGRLVREVNVEVARVAMRINDLLFRLIFNCSWPCSGIQDGYPSSYPTSSPWEKAFLNSGRNKTCMTFWLSSEPCVSVDNEPSRMRNT